MGKMTSSKLALLFAFFALLFVAAPAFAQAPAYGSCPPGSETPEEEPCIMINPSCEDDHDMTPVIDAVNQAIANLGGAGAPGIQDIPPASQGPDGNCGPGLIVEEAVRILRTLVPPVPGNPGLLFKNWGNQCNNHSVDVVIFDDGCAFDVIIGSGAPGQRGGSITLCCGNPPCQSSGCCPTERYCANAPCPVRPITPPPGGVIPPGPPAPPGACGPRDMARFNYVFNRLRAGDDPVQICIDFNATFTSTPANECLYYPTGPYVGIEEWYFYFGRPDPDPRPGDPPDWFDVLRVCDPSLPFTRY